MRKTGLIALAVVVVIAGVYLAGDLPQRRGRTAAEAEAQTLQTRLADAETRLRVGSLLGQALTIKEVAMRQNYGQALDLSSPFFDAVGTEAAAAPGGALADGLQDVLGMRDSVTAALAKADPAVVETLHAIEVSLRRALAYPLPPELPLGGG